MGIRRGELIRSILHEDLLDPIRPSPGRRPGDAVEPDAGDEGDEPRDELPPDDPVGGHLREPDPRGALGPRRSMAP